MNILFILNFSGILKPKIGCQNRIFNLMTQINKRDNNSIILEPVDFNDPDDKKFGSVYNYNDLKLFSRAVPLSKDINLNFIRKIWKIIKMDKPDVVLASHPTGIIIIKLMILLSREKISLIYDAHNVESEFTKEIFTNNNQYSKVEQFIIPFYVKILETIACKYLVDHITSVSRDDRDVFIKKYKLDKNKVSVLPSGCHISNSISKKEKKDIKKKMGIDPSCKVIIFHGSYSHPPNEEAFKLIKEYIAPKFENVNNVLFLLGGSGTPVFETSNIRSIGFIDNLSEFLSVADIAIVPLKKGGGTKLKLLDYLGAGLAIVTTKKGIEGIEAKNDQHVLVTDFIDDDFITSIKYLVENENERRKISNNARKLAEDKYDWNTIGKNLNNLIKV